MKQRRLVTTPEADEDAQRIDQWWMRNRSAAPDLFIEDLADALALLWGATRGTTPRFAERAASTKSAPAVPEKETGDDSTGLRES